MQVLSWGRIILCKRWKVESRIGGGFGCCGCTGASASYIDHVIEEEERYWKVQLEKKEEIVECILSKT